MEKSNIIEIEKEYKRIDNKWLRLHGKTSIGLVIFALFFECIMGCLLYKMGEINTTIPKYMGKYLLLPLVVNAFFLGIGYWAIHFSRITQNIKIYVVSLLFVGICFVLFSVHGIFNSLYLIFTIPILFTMVYGNYRLTTITAASCIAANVFSELFIKWDPDKINIMENNIELANFIISLVFLTTFYVVTMVVIGFEKGKNAVSIQKELERYQLRHKLQYDELTAINNRTALRNALQKMESDTVESIYFFVMMDIDNFKMLNDTLGHQKGDSILSQFGNILKVNCMDATPFRFGGDEFCILFKNKTVESVLEKCEKIQRHFKEMVAMQGIEVPLTVSIGIAHYLYGMTATQLVKNADLALYSSKTLKNAIHIFDNKKGEIRRFKEDRIPI